VRFTAGENEDIGVIHPVWFYFCFVCLFFFSFVNLPVKKKALSFKEHRNSFPYRDWKR